jgi:hypothetical protein
LNSTEASQRQAGAAKDCFRENDSQGQLSRCIEINPQRYLKKSGNSSRIIEFKKCPGNDNHTIGEELSLDSAQDFSASKFKCQNLGIKTPLGRGSKGLDSGKNTKTLRDLNRGIMFHKISFGKLGTKDQGGCRGSAKNWVN